MADEQRRREESDDTMADEQRRREESDDDDPHEDDLANDFSALLDYSVAFQQRSDERGVEHLDEGLRQSHDRRRVSAAHRDCSSEATTTDDDADLSTERSALLDHYDYCPRTPAANLGGVQAFNSPQSTETTKARYTNIEQAKDEKEKQGAFLMGRNKNKNKRRGHSSASAALLSPNSTLEGRRSPPSLRHRSFGVGSEGPFPNDDFDENDDQYIPSVAVEVESGHVSSRGAINVGQGDEASTQELSIPRRVLRWIGTWTWLTWLKLSVLLILLTAIIVCLAVFHSQIQQGLVDFLNWIQGLGALGPVLLVLIYIVACVLFIPGSVITIGAGFVFGLLWGFVSVSIGSTLGAGAAFLLGRFLVRDWVADQVKNNAVFHSVDLAIGRQGWLIVLLIRLSPVIPFNLINYALALTRIPFLVYFFVSWIGMIPGTLLYVYVGVAAREIAGVGKFTGSVDTSSTKAFFYFGFVVAFVALVVITIVAREAINKALKLASLQELEQSGKVDPYLVQLYKVYDPLPPVDAFVLEDVHYVDECPAFQQIEHNDGRVEEKQRHLIMYSDRLLITNPIEQKKKRWFEFWKSEDDEVQQLLGASSALAAGTEYTSRSAPVALTGCKYNIRLAVMFERHPSTEETSDEDCFDLLVDANDKHPEGLQLRFRVDPSSGRNAHDWSAHVSENVQAFAVRQEIETQCTDDFEVEEEHSTLSS
eukprot:CAMPEP_0177686930 /NCGR_PEP_ID=MMETSP0447-20121125/33839_1 /TAXON_ID=0 /ORGANISM="Stygamoeba regulata, Strain BSH-02190019" /LENGTH=705 /DNA_ID=CAMNT_0019197101 /DNA_START=34 /DNA_END=2151 /DNA_ORIENTATION=-